MNEIAIPLAQDSPLVSSSHAAMATSVCPLTETQTRIENSLDKLLATLPEDAEAATAHAAVALDLHPQPELMHALHLLARPGTAQPLRGELLRKLILLRLLVDKHLRELNRSSCIEPRSLGVASRAITTLIELVSAMRLEFGTRVMDLHHYDSQQFDGLMRALMPATDRLNSYGLLISMLEPLAREAAAGRAGKIVYLKRHEADLFNAALSRKNESGPAGRVILDTVALRCGLQETLEEWNELARTAPADSATDAAPDSPRRQEILTRLRVGMSIYNVLLERIQYQQSATLSEGDKTAFDHISSAQRLLFAVYSQIAGVVRDPDSINRQEEDDVDSALDHLFTEVAEAEENACPEQAEEEVYLEALTRIRDKEQGYADPTMTTGIDPRKQRRRRNILLAAAAVLAVIALGVNIALWKTTTPPPAPALDEFAAAMPLDKAAIMGPAMYAEIPAFNWNAMDLEERTRRVDLMGELAAERGFHTVILVDESRMDLAHWSREAGAVLTPAGSTLPD